MTCTADEAASGQLPVIGVGTELIVELWAPAAIALGDVESIRSVILRAASRSGSTVVRSFFHAADDGRVSGFALLKESHISIHTWPQDGYAAVDFFTCGKADSYKAVAEVQCSFRPQTMKVMHVVRGSSNHPKASPGS